MAAKKKERFERSEVPMMFGQLQIGTTPRGERVFIDVGPHTNLLRAQTIRLFRGNLLLVEACYVADEVAPGFIDAFKGMGMKLVGEPHRCGACSAGKHVDCSNWCFCDCEHNR